MTKKTVGASAPKAKKPAAKKAAPAKATARKAAATAVSPIEASEAPRPARAGANSGAVHCGIGGWTFEPWRGVFYPDGLSQAKELQYASRKLTSIEINGTYYRTQSPATYRKWASEVPDGFIFALKGLRYVTNRGVLAEAGDSLRKFLESGVLELGTRLGPLLWQMNPNKKFNEADFGKFLELLPHEMDGRRLRHVVEVRHDSFLTPAFIALLRQFNVAVVFAEHATYPAIADVTADFVYARLQKGRDDVPTAYPAAVLGEWTRRLRTWANGGAPDDLPCIDKTPAPKTPRDVFAYVIHEGKVRAPAAAMEMIRQLG